MWQPGGQRAAVQPDPCRHVFGDGDPATRLEAFPAQQVAQRTGGRLVAALGGRSTPLQRGHRVDRDPVQAPRRALAHGQKRHQLVVCPDSATADSSSTACASRRCAVASEPVDMP